MDGVIGNEYVQRVDSASRWSSSLGDCIIELPFFFSATSPDARSNFDLALRASIRPDTESNEQGTANGLELDVELALKQDEHVSDVEAVDDAPTSRLRQLGRRLTRELQSNALQGFGLELDMSWRSSKTSRCPTSRVSTMCSTSRLATTRTTMTREQLKGLAQTRVIAQPAPARGGGSRLPLEDLLFFLRFADRPYVGEEAEQQQLQRQQDEMAACFASAPQSNTGPRRSDRREY